MQRLARTLAAPLAVALIIALLPAASADERPAGRFLAISDVHLDPFGGMPEPKRLLDADVADWPAILPGADAPPASYGADANVPLFLASVADARTRLPAPDFVVYPGDFVVHELERKIVAAGGDAAQMPAMAVKITRYLADRLREAFPDAPILPALGNTDSACGDYRIEPGGAYLADTLPMLETLVGRDRLAPDAAATWRAGGYYAARHPTVANARFIVLNNIFWTPEYENACGGAAAGREAAPGESMLAWLRNELAETRRAGERAWLVYHVPAGVNAYPTVHARQGDGATCRSTTVPFWHERYRTPFEALMVEYREVVATAFSGHIHRDSWRLLRDGSGSVAAWGSIVPAISPIYDDAPAYQIFDYDPASGRLIDKTTVAVTNLAEAARGATIAFAELYRFTAAYGLSPYGSDALATLSRALETPRPSGDRTLYARFYGSGHGDDPDEGWPVYGCTPGNVPIGAFDACRCGD